MPNTTNYNWELPTPGGSEGAWATILNAAFDDIDGEMYAAQNAGGAGIGTPSGTSGEITLDLSTGHTFVIDTTSPLVIAFSNVPAGAVRVTIILVNIGVAPVLFSDTIYFNNISADSSGSLNGGSAKFRRYELLTVDGGTTWYSTRISPVL